MKPAEELNKIISSASVGTPPINQKIQFRSFGLFRNAIIFKEEGLLAFNDAIDKLHKSDKNIHQTTSRKWFDGEIIKAISENIFNTKMVSDTEAKQIIGNIRNTAIITTCILREIHGVSMSPASNPVRLGHFTIYNMKAHEDLLQARSTRPIAEAFSPLSPEYLIEISVAARDNDRLIQLADAEFEIFEHIIRFLIGYKTDKLEVGIINYTGRHSRQAYRIHDSSIGANFTAHGSIEKVPIDDPYFTTPENGYDELWAIASSESKNELQKRILMSIDWIGQSLNEKKLASAFIKAAIAIELLFTNSENTIVTPSIMSQICEGCCFLLEESQEKRIELESKIKKIYGLRSAIVHSGSTKVDIQSYQFIVWIARSIIISLTTKPNLKKIETLGQLSIFLKSLKYSAGAI